MSTFEATETVDVTAGAPNTSNEPFVETADVTDDEKETDGEKEADADAEEKPAEEEKKKLEIDVSELRYENVWKEQNEKARKGCMDLWTDQFGDVMPKEAKESRLDFICVVCWHGGKIVAVSTMMITPNQNLWIKIGMFRCMVHEDYRRNGIATQLINECKKALSKYAKEHPSEDIKAIGVTFHKTMFPELAKKPFWPENNLTLVGYSQDGMQVRLAYLDDAEVSY